MVASLQADQKPALKYLIRRLSIKEGDFTLASGAKSDIFFDMKPTLLTPIGSHLVSNIILDMIKNTQLDAIGGLILGACPIVSSVVLRSLSSGQSLEGFYIRKDIKDHGTQRQIEGLELNSNHKILLVEDVTSTGGSLIKAINAVRDHGAQIVKVISIVDRELGADVKLKSMGYQLEYIFKRSELLADNE